MRKTLLVIALLAAISQPLLAGPIFPSRGFLMHPRWDGPDSTIIFGHSGFYSGITRGLGSDSDRWGWTIQIGAILEFARWDGNKSLFAFSSNEIIADTHSDIDFNPRGAIWEEGLQYSVHESSRLDWDAGMIYRCRHDIDNADPEQYNGIGAQRTLIYCSAMGRLLWRLDSTSVALPITAWLRSDVYAIEEDYRLPYSDGHVGTSFDKLAWSLQPGILAKLITWNASSIYLFGHATLSAFGSDTGFMQRWKSIDRLTLDAHVEAGYEFHGLASRLQLFAGFEQWQDDGQTPIPRDSRQVLIGFRLVGTEFSAW
jgi:hypothetical protein